MSAIGVLITSDMFIMTILIPQQFDKSFEIQKPKRPPIPRRRVGTLRNMEILFVPFTILLSTLGVSFGQALPLPKTLFASVLQS